MFETFGLLWAEAEGPRDIALGSYNYTAYCMALIMGLTSIGAADARSWTQDMSELIDEWERPALTVVSPDPVTGKLIPVNPVAPVRPVDKLELEDAATQAEVDTPALEVNLTTPQETGWSLERDPFTRDISKVRYIDVSATELLHLAQRKLKYLGYYHGYVPELTNLTPKGAALYTELMTNPRARAALVAVTYGEGTYTGNLETTAPYYIKFGGGYLGNLQAYPDTVWHVGDISSSAAGRYQFMAYTWPGVAKALGVTDFSPAAQDLAALYQVVYKHGCWDDIDSGNFGPSVLDKLAREWASIAHSSTGKSYYNTKGGQYNKVGGTPQPAISQAAITNVYSQWLSYFEANGIPPIPSDVSFNTEFVAALRDFQYDYQLRQTGKLDTQTKLALFDGVMGDVVGQPYWRDLANYIQK